MSDTLDYVKQNLGYGIATIGTAIVAVNLFYGTSLTSSILYQSRNYSSLMKQRILKTALYYKVSYLISIVSGSLSYLVDNNPGIINTTASMSNLFLLASTSFHCQNFPNSKSKKMGIKELSWIVHSITLGVILSPMFRNSPSSSAKIFIIHMGALLGLTAIAVVIPNNKHVKMKKIAFTTLITILLFSLVGRSIKDTSPYHDIFYAVELYGGYSQFSLNYILDLQAMIDNAQVDEDSKKEYDPLINSLKLTVNSVHLLLRTNSILPYRYMENTALSPA